MIIDSQSRRALVALASAAILAACSADTPVAPTRLAAGSALARASALTPEERDAAATLRRATGRYQNLNNAIADGFVFLHGCETRDEGAVGTVYVHPERLFDATINPALPDALIYEPGSNGQLALVGVELAIPYVQWQPADPPTFLGYSFQSEDEFQVYGLHAWVWRDNPNGLFEEVNPRVSCGVE